MLGNGKDELSTCVSCGNQHRGLYCNRCGEKVLLPKEKAILHYLQQVLNAFTFAETKLWASLKNIVWRPGLYSSDIAAGKRVKYMRPVNLFLLCNLVYFLFPVAETFNTSLASQTKGQLYSAPMHVEKRVMDKAIESNIGFEEFERLYNEKSSANSKLMLILLSPLFSIGFCAVGFKRKKYYSEHLLISFEYGIFTLLVNTILLPLIIFPIFYWIGSSSIGLNVELDFYFSGIVAVTSLYFLTRALGKYYGFTGVSFFYTGLLIFGWTIISLPLYRWLLLEVTLLSF